MFSVVGSTHVLIKKCGAKDTMEVVGLCDGRFYDLTHGKSYHDQTYQG